VTPNKLLSKIGSELDKPDGLTILGLDDVPARIWPLSVRKINGIGPKAGARLATLGINTVAELAHAAPALLQEHFGLRYAQWLVNAARGIDARPVVTHSEPKSISRETTFERDLHVVHDRSVLSVVFLRLCEQLGGDLARKGYVARTVGIKLRFDNFHTVTRDITLPDSIADAVSIHHAAGVCLKRLALDHRIRLLGVRVSSLLPAAAADHGSHGIAQGAQLSLY
jgi:DNA polymerase-4